MDVASYWQLLSTSLEQRRILSDSLSSDLATVCLQHWKRCLGACRTPDTIVAIQQVLTTAVAKAPDHVRQGILVELLVMW